MSLVDKPFKEAIRNLPLKKMSWRADRRTKKMIRYRVAEMEGRLSWFSFFEMFKKLVAVPVALAMFLTSTGGYAYYSPTVVRGDLLYTVKTGIEEYRYPANGTSEQRIAFHLWLSERRYDEVNEILSRFGKSPVSLIPAAQAASESDIMGQYLLATLQSATQHVDYAFLISDEIRDTKRVQVVKEQIRGTLEKQRVFLEKSAPLLKEVKLQEPRKSRIKKLKPQPVLEMHLDLNTETPALLETPEAVQNDQFVQNEELTVDVEDPLPVFEELFYAEDLNDANAFIADRLNFQDGLLEKVNGVLTDAESNGHAMVRLMVVLEPLIEDEDMVDGFFKQALTVHYQNSRKILETEIQDLDKELETSALPSDQNQAPAIDFVETSSTSSEKSEGASPKSNETPLKTSESSQTPVGSNSPKENTLPDPVNTLPPEREKLPTEEVLERALLELQNPPLPQENPSVPDPDASVSKPPVAESTPPQSTPTQPSPTQPAPPQPVSPPSVPPQTAPSQPSSETTAVPVSDLPKSICELKADTTCQGSVQVNCLKQAIQSCEAQLKLEKERQEQERLNLERSELMKKELEELQRKMEQLQSSIRNSAPLETIVNPEQMKAGLMATPERKK